MENMSVTTGVLGYENTWPKTNYTLTTGGMTGANVKRRHYVKCLKTSKLAHNGRLTVHNGRLTVFPCSDGFELYQVGRVLQTEKFHQAPPKSENLQISPKTHKLHFTFPNSYTPNIMGKKFKSIGGGVEGVKIYYRGGRKGHRIRNVKCSSN